MERVKSMNDYLWQDDPAEETERTFADLYEEAELFTIPKS